MGLTVAIGQALGIFFDIFSGTAGDMLHLGWGKRRPLMAAGTLGAAAVVLVEARMPLLLASVATGYVAMMIFSGSAQGSLKPLLPDLVPQEQRGKAGGILTLFIMMGFMLGTVLTGYLVGSGQIEVALLVTAAALLLSLLPTAYTIRRDDLPNRPQVEKGLASSLADCFRAMFRARETPSGFVSLLVGIFLTYNGTWGLTYFELYYLQDVIRMKDAAYGVATAGAALLLASVVFGLLLGALSDRVSRKPFLVGGALASGLIMISLIFIRSFEVFLVAASALGAVIGIFVAVRNAAVSDMVPPSSSGRYMGYADIVVDGPSVVAPALDGALLFAFSAYMGGFLAVFLVSAALDVAGAALLARARFR